MTIEYKDITQVENAYQITTETPLLTKRELFADALIEELNK